MKHVPVAKSVFPMALTVLTSTVAISLTIVPSPSYGKGSIDKVDSRAKASTQTPQKQSEVVEHPESNKEMRKELNLPDAPTVHGFHPIKQTFVEMTEIESINMRLYQEMKKLEAPVSALQPTMLQLQNTMLNVDNQMNITNKQLGSVGSQMDAMHQQMGVVGDKMGTVGERMGLVSDKMGSVQKQIGRVGEKMDMMHDQLSSVGQKLEGMHGQLSGVGGQIGLMESGMAGLRQDLKSIRADLAAVRSQVNGLQKPIEQIRDPLLEVAGPLEGLGKRLDRLQTLVSYVLIAIVLATVGIAIGTPIAAFLIHKSHSRLLFEASSAKERELSKSA
ncbi:MAG: hypothetical protein K2X27_10585 [Candidatus Obscuribacterales bacterium]|nr:hypothetical protein [Candidatus Obscuribacterales bacterium]